MADAVLTLGASSYHATVSELRNCRHAHVILTPASVVAAGAPAAAAAAAAAFGPDRDVPDFELHILLLLRTNTSQPGIACETWGAPECGVMVRQLPVRWSAAKQGYTATFVPDSAAAHYRVLVQSAGQESLCFVSPMLTSLPFVNVAPEPPMNILLNTGCGYFCHPVLHLDMPSMHDFYIATLEGGRLTAPAPASTLDPAAADAASHVRVCEGCPLAAAYGLNRLVVRAPALLHLLYPAHVRNVTMYGRILNQQYIVNINPSFFYDEQLGGYPVTFDLRDEGEFVVQLAVSWYFGSVDPPLLPEPIQVGGHMGDHNREADLIRAMVHGGEVLRVGLDGGGVHRAAELAALPRFGSVKCDHSDSPARWVNMDDRPCAPPFCTGNRTATVNNIDSNPWVRRVWVWVPHDCYHHLYDKEDLYRCAAADDVSWIHAMGDSQERELVSMLKQVNGSLITATKYIATDFRMHGSPNDLRVTWQFYTDTMNSQGHFDASDGRAFARDQHFFDHFNIRPSADSGQPERHVDLPDAEDTRPSVFLMNNANAHAGKYQPFWTHVRWMNEFVKYIDGGKALASPDPVPGRPGLSKPMRLVWLSAPTTNSRARPGNVYMTTHRTAMFTYYSESVMRSLGVPVVDARSLTQSRWESSYDGLHYAAQMGGDNWGSQVASMEFQTALNVVFPVCGPQV